MKFDKVVLITNIFPYNTGEEFLENEINYIVKNTNKLIILPISSAEKYENRLLLSERNNIEVININFKRSKFAKLLSFFHPSMYSMLCFSEYVKIIKKNKCNPKCFLRAMSFMSDVSWIFKKANVLLEKYLFKNDERVLFYSYWMSIEAGIAVKLKELYGGRLVSRVHGSDLYYERHVPAYLPFRQYLFENCDVVCPISNIGKKYLIDKNPKYAAKIHTYRLGTNDYGIQHCDDTSVFNIVSCSNMIPLKRIEYIVQALAKINKKINWIHYGDGFLRDKIEKMAKNLLPSNISWNFAGQKKHEDLMKLYSKSYYHLFINVSTSEGIPVSIMEAMSFGIPVLATDVGGTSEIVQSGYNGFLLPSEITFERLSEYIVSVIDMKELDYVCMRQNARETWCKYYNADDNYKLFWRFMQDGL